MTTTLQERLHQLMKENGNWTEIDLVKATRLPQPTVHHILSGATARPRRKTLIAIAKALSISISELFEDPTESADSNLAGSLEYTVIPLLTWEQAAIWPQLQEVPHYFDQTEHALTDTRVSKRAFSVTIKDSSMETLFPVGTLLIADPDKQPKDKSYVIVHKHDEKEAIFKQVLMAGNQCYLKSLNPLFDKLEPVALQENDHIVGIVVQTRMPLE